ncbi:MAG: amidohydrolase [Chloroflexi bacterium]|nr:amidohydrolase [Chloroflexota bacterium]
MPQIKAIDFLNSVTTPEWVDRVDVAGKQEIICRMQASLGGKPPSYPSIEKMIEAMDKANVEKVLISEFRMFSHWNKRWYVDTKAEEVLQYTEKHPDRFAGLASYNPFRIKESLEEIEWLVKDHGFKGVYVHVYGFDTAIDDRTMYPLYAKCQELGVPVALQVGYVLEAMYSEYGRPIYLDRIALDFPSLKIIGAHTGYPWCEELIAICYKYDNIYFGVDAHMPKYLEPNVVKFINTRGQDKVIWGSNGLPWDKMLQQIDDLGLKEDVKKKLLHDNAVKVFKL